MHEQRNNSRALRKPVARAQRRKNRALLSGSMSQPMRRAGLAFFRLLPKDPHMSAVLRSRSYAVR